MFPFLILWENLKINKFHTLAQNGRQGIGRLAIL